MWEIAKTLLSKLWPAIPGAIISAVISFYIFTARMDVLRLDQQKALSVQASSYIQKCNADKKITEDVQNETQTRINSLNDQLASLKRLRPAKCVPVLSGPAGQHNGTTGSGKLPISNGLRSEWLYDFSGRCESTRIELIGCQEFIKKERQ
jgi:hypothetical protein